MKKQFIKPELKIIAMETSSIVANSFSEVSLHGEKAQSVQGVAYSALQW